ncbi:phosphatidate cytidylyltransferase [Chryseobacterium sp. Leaf180]|jgi:glucan phosphoethanolaminetransferase (alkaline phosphatase superfamily)|uniref:hypothetical protein n=1 Tax=Chryseobacterium sp. Leaf180 TaxID=1736289 RepID=UPI00070001E2|nr:hypothetical protein [Chryseobacterium sp. Leaf180]KQR93264.1 phosphatidate cytidylyltransferase [Chryseobacterium sp. Leaf180]
MKKLTLFGITMFSAMMLTSCSAIETIFKAGMWWGFILVGLVIAAIIWIFSRNRNS